MLAALEPGAFLPSLVDLSLYRKMMENNPQSGVRSSSFFFFLSEHLSSLGRQNPRTSGNSTDGFLCTLQINRPSSVTVETTHQLYNPAERRIAQSQPGTHCHGIQRR